MIEPAVIGASIYTKLIDPSQPMKKSGSGILRACKILGILLLASVAVPLIADRFLPQVYFAKLTMEVKPTPSGQINVFGTEMRRGVDPEFLAMQFQILRGSEILDQVIDNLKLTEVWYAHGAEMNKQTALSRMLAAMELRGDPQTGLIEVGAYSPKPEEAADIANTIAVVYQQKLLGDLQKDIVHWMEQLKEEIEKQRKRAKEALAEVAAIRERDGIIDPDPDAYGLRAPSAPDNVDLRPYLEAKTRAFQAKRIYEAAQTKYATELLQRGIDFDPAKIWEKAEPPIKPTRFCLYRLRHALARYSSRYTRER